MAASISSLAKRSSYWSRGLSVETWMTGPSARDNAFDAIRLIAASSVIISHSFMISTASNASEPIYWLSSGQTTIGGLAVGVFFIISGVFISASFDRSKSLYDFVFKRVKRIVPALLVVVLLSIFLLGPLFTNLPLQDYFRSAETWGYLKNVAFLPNAYTLPGVFTDHPIQAVNGSVWTLKFEVICYAIAAASLSLKRFRNGVVWFGWIASFVVFRFAHLIGELNGILHYISTTAMLFRYFGAGMIIYLYCKNIILNDKLALLFVGLSAASIFTPIFVEVTAVLLPYAVITFGFSAPRWFKNLTRHGDFSYGVYIYGWPVQQMVTSLGAGLAIHWWTNSLISTAIALCLGVLSWTIVEKPALSLTFLRGQKATRAA